jgi:hypothetical protein
MHWVYYLPNWLFGVLTVFVFAFSGWGDVVTRRWVPSLHHSEVSHNDIVGFCFGAITVLYGITLGLLMVGVWTTFSEAQQKVDREASCLAAFYRDLSNFPEPSRSQLQTDLRRYTRTVIDVGWPLQQKGIVPRSPNKTELDDLGRHLTSFNPATEAQKTLLSESSHQNNELVEWRRSRHVSVTAGLSTSLWALVLIGAVISIAVSWAFHVKNRRMHLWMTALVSSLLGLMVFLLAAMDHPFMGKISVSSAPFEIVYETLMKPDNVAVGSPMRERCK